MIVLLAAAMLMLQPQIVIDDFESVAAWKPVPSDDVTLRISQGDGVHGRAMRIDFDFHGHGGYAVIHRDVNLTLPANYEFSWAIRGEAPVNTLEFKLIDPSGDNVWWSNQPGFVFPSAWRNVVRKKRHISFAWGPLGGGEMQTVAAMEIAITAGTGGKGTVWIDDLALAPLEVQAAYTLTPRVTASSNVAGYGPARVLDRSASTAWRSTAAKPQTLNIDFLKRREFGGLVIDWEANRRPAAYAVTTSIDGISWSDPYEVGSSSALRDYLYLPESDARYIRLSLAASPAPTNTSGRIGLKEITVEPLAWSASRNDYMSAIARDSRPGDYPRYYSGKQSYWTVIGVNGDTREGLMDVQGRIESGKGQFSVEPFLLAGGRLITWNDASPVASTVGIGLPIPVVTWKTNDIAMAVTGFAAGRPDSSVLYARYRVSNPTATAKSATLYLAVRPFQVNPPWQFLNTQGGVARIDSISYQLGNVRVNGNRIVIPLTIPTAFGAMSSGEGSLVELLRQSRLPSSTQASDPLGFGTGAMSFALTLKPHADTTIDIAIPLHDPMPTCANVSINACRHGWALDQFKATTSYWNEKLGRVAIKVPAEAEIFPTSIRANLAYVLINRDGPAIQPGSRSYERSWIRDGALTSAALLRLGQFDEVKNFIDWYAGHQFANGKIPCCVDARGADPVPENDSQGEFIFLVAEYYRHTGDRALLERTWPNVSRAFAFMDSLRQSRTTAEYQSGDKRVFYGLMPQSISHEGYSAKPMHSYWDDFFALRGFKDAAEIATVLGKPEAANYANVRDTFRRDFYASIRLSMSQHNIDYIPGAAELGDFDATSTTIALNPADELASIPQPALNRTFQKSYENFVSRRDGEQTWEAYTPYEWRVVGTMVRLGEKAKAHEIASFFFKDQRPQGWHQWGEVVYRDSLNPKFIGDMPHTWVGSDFIRSTLDMFAFEREGDSSLVVGAGIPEAWVRKDNGVSIKGLSTHYGLLSYRMTAQGTELRVALDAGTRIPPGGIVVESPSSRPVRSVTVNGSPGIAGKSGSVTVRSLPAAISFSY